MKKKIQKSILHYANRKNYTNCSRVHKKNKTHKSVPNKELHTKKTPSPNTTLQRSQITKNRENHNTQLTATTKIALHLPH